ncbi:Lipocalin-related protein and Bos/Can/Equ allergen [Rhodovulum sp. PH10]|uniref:YeeE/YedE family protein n=1 Tax=Rhodovulum sp. PH10 TaxID=1187851 RepID=UPI00027C2425|nr:YeeE/YedE family protein [Rhodovulum sp. PH10]EJW09281.1 Lipocalin-related protein and Bos/Can/Equ allergen [Rhodovulum sp. PH10]
MDATALVDALGEGPVLALGGLVVGAAFGFAAQRSRFCLRAAALEFFHGEVGQRVAVWLMAFATAVVWTQGFILLELLDVSEARQLAQRGSLSGAAIGGLMFGAGMVMTRGCASRLLVLSATGNLRALLSGLVMAVAAQSAMSGALAPLRETITGWWTIDGGSARDLLVVLGLGHGHALAFGLVWCAAAYVYAVKSRLPAASWFTASGVGGMVALGWLFTYTIAQSSFAVPHVTSITFTGPSADTLMVVLDRTRLVWDFDIGLVPGVFVGSLAGALLFREFALVGFRDAVGMRRYIAGAVLMGFGGMLAGGCAVGAGVSGGAIFALTAWVTLACIWAAAGVTDFLLDREVPVPAGAVPTAS